MINVQEYYKLRKEYMTRYEKTVREWLFDKGGLCAELAYEIPFFMDGVVSPKDWCSNTDFRPLFIMKEPSIGLSVDDENSALNIVKQYIEKWGEKVFDFTENEFDDIQIGTFPTWMRIAKLTRTLEETKNDEYNGCSDYDFRFQSGGDINPYINKFDHLSEKKKNKYQYRTKNDEYISTIRKIAVVNIKKIGGGTRVDSTLSLAGQHFTEYLNDEKIQGLIYEQINHLIKPTIIVFCGTYGKSIAKLFDTSKIDSSIALIEAYHPSYVKSDEEHCNKVHEQYFKWLKENEDMGR
ncbi:MAG: hypothetical protein ACI39H_00140 [Lachnospiraceae bacterium]